MKPNIFKSRKFWLMILDLVLSLVLFFGAKYLMPGVFEDVKYLIGALQPVFVFLIISIAIEDAAAMKSGLVSALPGQ
jgi:hypothetical protein